MHTKISRRKHNTPKTDQSVGSVRHAGWTNCEWLLHARMHIYMHASSSPGYNMLSQRAFARMPTRSCTPLLTCASTRSLGRLHTRLPTGVPTLPLSYSPTKVITRWHIRSSYSFFTHLPSAFHGRTRARAGGVPPKYGKKMQANILRKRHRLNLRYPFNR